MKCRTVVVEKRAELLPILLSVLLTACNLTAASSGSNTALTPTPTPAIVQFAGGQKGIKIVTSVTTGVGSFAAPSATPVQIVIPSPLPGNDGSSLYLPGVSPTLYYNLDGTVAVKPAWLLDFQLGITSKTASSACATFGGSSSAGGTSGALSLDVQDYYRVSESNCSAKTGAGGPVDPVFVRILLDRNTAYLGSAENLLLQMEYQASGIHLNSDGTDSDPENNVDQLWKIFWDSTLGAASAPKPFAVFIPPNYSACVETGVGDATALAGAVNVCNSSSYRGSPIKTRQFIIPLSAYPTLSVIQLSRVKGRADQGTNYVNGTNKFCGTDDPLCAGVVIRSVTLMRF